MGSLHSHPPPAPPCEQGEEQWSAICTGNPEHIPGCRVFDPGQHEQQIGQAVEIVAGRGRDRVARRHGIALGAAHDGAGEVEVKGSLMGRMKSYVMKERASLSSFSLRNTMRELAG